LPAGTHTLALGGFNNKKNSSSERTTIRRRDGCAAAPRTRAKELSTMKNMKLHEGAALSAAFGGTPRRSRALNPSF
jgi:hypothetical protein